jgi:hypothetical protein
MELNNKTIEELEAIKMQIDIQRLQNDIVLDSNEFKLKFKQWDEEVRLRQERWEAEKKLNQERWEAEKLEKEKEAKLNQERWEAEKIRLEKEMKFYPWTNAAIAGLVGALVSIIANLVPKVFN